MKSSIKLMIIFCFLFAQMNSEAKDIHDIFYQQSYDTYRQSEDLISKYSQYKNKIDVSFIRITTNDSDKLLKFNEDTKQLCIGYVTDEQKAMKLSRESQERMTVVFEIANSSNDYQQSYSDKSPAQLIKVKSDIISIIDQQVLLEVAATFKWNPSRRYSNDQFEILHYYIYNLKTNQFERWVNHLNQADLDKIKEYISSQIETDYLVNTAKLDKSDLNTLDEIEEGSIEKPSIKNLITTDDLQNADFIWFGWNLILQFQDYTSASKIYEGESFHASIPFSDAIALLSDIPAFNFLQNLPENKKTFTGFHHDELIRSYSYANRPEGDELIRLLPTKSIKSVVSTRYQINFRNGNKYASNKTQHEFNVAGKILSKMVYDKKESIIQSNYYQYTPYGKLSSYIKKNKRGEETSEVHNYDELNNLISVSRITEHNQNNKLYYYFGDAIYYMNKVSTEFEIHKAIQKLYFNEKTYIAGNDTMIFDSQSRIVGNKGGSYLGALFQVGYDETGRMVESHRDRDRYHCYWEYDELGRFISFKNYDSNKLTQKIECEYEGAANLPFKSTKTESNHGSPLIIVYEFEWEFFE